MKNIRYASVGLSEREILCEQNLVIYITECQNNCVGCHNPYMHDKYGDYLSDYFDEIFETYKSYITCVCFMGEGLNSNLTRKELIDYCSVIHQNGKKTALYSGRDCDIEDWMYCLRLVLIRRNMDLWFFLLQIKNCIKNKIINLKILHQYFGIIK